MDWLFEWCPGLDSNQHERSSHAPQACASTNFATRAYLFKSPGGEVYPDHYRGHPGLSFQKPGGEVYPDHYRGHPGLSDFSAIRLLIVTKKQLLKNEPQR